MPGHSTCPTARIKTDRKYMFFFSWAKDIHVGERKIGWLTELRLRVVGQPRPFVCERDRSVCTTVNSVHRAMTKNNSSHVCRRWCCWFSTYSIEQRIVNMTRIFRNLSSKEEFEPVMRWKRCMRDDVKPRVGYISACRTDDSVCRWPPSWW